MRVTMYMSFIMRMRVLVRVLVRMSVRVLVRMSVRVLVRMSMRVLVRMLVSVLVRMSVSVLVRMSVSVLVRMLVRVRMLVHVCVDCAGRCDIDNVELGRLDLAALECSGLQTYDPLVEAELGEAISKNRQRDAGIDQRANRHVTADA